MMHSNVFVERQYSAHSDATEMESVKSY